MYLLRKATTKPQGLKGAFIRMLTINRIKGQRNNLRDFIFKHIKNLGELGLKTLSLAYETETSKTRQGQSKNCLVMF